MLLLYSTRSWLLSLDHSVLNFCLSSLQQVPACRDTQPRGEAASNAAHAGLVKHTSHGHAVAYSMLAVLTIAAAPCLACCVTQCRVPCPAVLCRQVQLMMLKRHLASLGVTMTDEEAAQLTTAVSSSSWRVLRQLVSMAVAFLGILAAVAYQHLLVAAACQNHAGSATVHLATAVGNCGSLACAIHGHCRLLSKHGLQSSRQQGCALLYSMWNCSVGR